MYVELLVHFTSMLLVSLKVGLVVVISPLALNIRCISHTVCCWKCSLSGI